MQRESNPGKGLRYWRLLFFLTALLLVVNVAVTYYTLSRVNKTYDALHRSMDLIMAVRTSYSAIQDVAISERDYLIRGDDVSLERYRESVNAVVEQVREMDDFRYRLGSPLNLENLKSLLLRRLRVESLHDVDISATATPLSRDQWKASANRALLLEIRAAVDTIESAHVSLLAARKAAVVSSERSIVLSLVLVTLLGVLGIAAMYRVLKRLLAQQEQWELQLVQQKQKLEDTVAERTASLQQYSLDLQRSNRELEDFAFVASHDLQEPLRKILAFGDRLNTRYANELGEGKDYLDRMRNAATRMSKLINDLLAFSRVTTSSEEFIEVPLNEVLGDVLDDLEETINSSGAIIRADSLPTIEGNQTQLHQVFLNLIANALKFVDEQTVPKVRISAQLRQAFDSGVGLPGIPAELLEIHVIDNGIGFNQDHADRIFKPFQRLVTRQEFAGTGIGLAVTRRIVERHGGNIEVSSEIGHGSDFMIVLPTTQEIPGKVPPRQGAAAFQAQETPSHDH